MKYTTILALMLMVPVALLAAPKNSASVTFPEAVTINGTQVPAGDYRVQWQGTGTAVEASILHGKQVVATAPATLVNTKNDYDGAIETSDGENNSKILNAIDWNNRSLRFGPANATTSVGAMN